MTRFLLASNFLSWNRLWPTCKVLSNEHDAADMPASDRVAARGTQGGAKGPITDEGVAVGGAFDSTRQPA
jgi:hypothetical protein